jgi:hypothetical protein
MSEPPPDPAYAGQSPSFPPPQQVPPQPGWPPAPYPPTPHPPVAYGPPPVHVSQWGYPPAPQPRASAATAIATSVAGILAGLFVGLVSLLYIGLSTDVPADAGWLAVVLIGVAVGFVIAAILLFVGSVLVPLHKLMGRWLIAAALAIVIVGVATPFVLRAASDAEISELLRRYALSTVSGAFEAINLLVWIGAPLIATVFAFLPSTRRYCVDKR